MVLTNIKYSSIILCILMLWSSVYNLNAQCGLTINPASASLCLGNSIALNASDTGNAAPFRWSPAAGLSSTTGANIVASPTSTTTYTLKKNGCPDSATITITVKQLYIIAAAADSLCEDDQLLLSSLALGGNGVYSYNWSGPNGFISSAANPNVPNVSSVNGGTYIVTVTSNGCSISDSVDVIVNPLPIANQLPDTFICNGSLMGNGFIFSSTPPGATFTWTCSQNINFGISGSGDIPAFTATNTGAQNISETVFFNPVLKGCIGTNENFKITIKPTPKLTSSTEEHLCDKSNFSYTATAQPQNSLFSWARAADVFGNVANSGNNATINENLFNNSVLPIEVMYVYTLTRPGIVNPCPKIDTLKVTVNPTPVLDIISNYSYCNGEVVMPIAFSTLTPNAAIEWTSSDNVGFGIAGINAIQGFVATNNTGVPIVATITVKIKASEDSCVGLNKTFTITVNSSPRLSSTQDTIICNSTSFNHLATSQTPNLDFSWTRAGVAGINGGLAAAGNDSLINEVLVNTDTIPIAVWYIFQMANNSGTCVGKDSMRVTVIPTPQLSSDTSPISICSGSLLVYNATSATPGAVFSWTRGAVIGINNDTASFGNSNLIQEVLLNNTDSIKTITYNISITTADTCTFNVQALTVTVYPAPKLSNVVTGFSTCNDAVFNFTATSNTQGTITYVWKRDSVQGITPYTSSGTGNTISEALNNSTPFIQVVTYAMTIIANNCSTIQHVTDTVFPTPLLTDTILADTICSGSSYVYNASSLTPGVVFSWSRAAVPNINGGLPANGSSSLIQDTLINSTNTVITVTYSVGLTAYGCPTNFQNITVAVNPTPLLSNTVLLKDSVCSGKLFLRNLSANISNTSFEWVRNPVLGISPLSNSGNTANISETLVNANSFAIDVTYIVKLTTPEGCINTQNIIVTVLPKPVLLDSVKRDTICSGSVYSYIGLSATSNTTLVWQRSPVSGIIPLSAVGTTNLIKDSIINITASPIVVKYFYTITSASGCIGLDSIELLVNPTPFIYDSSSSVCSGLQFQYEIVPLYATSNIFYSWTSDSVVNITGNNPQLPELPNAFIEDTLNNNLNNTIIPVKYNIIATYIDNNVRCQSSAVFTVNVLPLPKPPLFSSLTSNQTEIDLCGGSTNINFNISPSFIQDGVTYIWYALPGPIVFIADTTNPNTVISFDNITNTVQIAVTAYNNDSLGGCFATESQSVNLTVNNDSIQERKIFIKQPGNILVYPDNSMDATYTDSTGTVNGYQWGYDTIPSILKPDSLGVPLAIAGQVYQFFVPDIKYVDSQGLDTIHYAWWVLLRSGECRSKVYYNGPYAYNRYLEQPAQDNSIKLDIFPNPGNGNFTFMLNGKIYGDITLRVYDNIGQLVFQDLIEKKKYELTSPLKLNNLSDGIYSLELQSKDMQKISTRIIIIHN